MNRADGATGNCVHAACFVRAAGVAWGALFLLVGVGAGLALYADGSLFSYAIADGSAWAFHWHNIAQRAAVHLLTHVPAEAYVALTGDGRGGITLYAMLFFSAPLAGIASTWLLDHTPGRLVTVFACLSTLLLAPLVFGFPTELWLSASLVWPTVALLHGRRRWPWPLALALLLALAFTHEGGLLLASVVVGLLGLGGWRDTQFHRGLMLLGTAAAGWLAVKLAVPPDAYFASAYARSAAGFLDPGALVSPIMLTLYAALAGYAMLLGAAVRLQVRRPVAVAVGLTVAGLGAFWLLADPPVHAAERYPVRTVMLGGEVLLAVAAVLAVDAASGRGAGWAVGVTGAVSTLCANPAWVRAALGALAVVTVVHAVETARFVRAWQQYAGGVRALAMGAAADPGLGDRRFVSAGRLGERLNRLSWYSTTHYLSVLVAPDWAPGRLVVDPDAGYYWLTCAMAEADEQRPSAIPLDSRRLVRTLACLHR